MPKKTRKMKQRAAMRRSYAGTPPVEMDAADQPQETASPARPILSPITRTAVTPATYDYSHIYSDLKRIAIFAAFFFSVLIVLSFVIK